MSFIRKLLGKLTSPLDKRGMMKIREEQYRERIGRGRMLVGESSEEPKKAVRKKLSDYSDTKTP